ncbi:transposase, partial [Xanthomonas translucens]
EAKKGFVLLPRRWVVERSFGWVNRFRRLARDYERLPETLAGLHFVVFTVLMLSNAAAILQSSKHALVGAMAGSSRTIETRLAPRSATWKRGER